jgi:hypothetical protein
MGYINPEWLNSDEHARALKAADKYDQYTDAVDRQIIIDCLDVGILQTEIPVDILTGFTTSLHLRQLGVSYAMYALFSGHWGVRDTSSDIYRDKAERYYREYRDLRGRLTATKIKGAQECIVMSEARAQVSTVPIW